MRQLVEILGGLWALFCLGVRSKFRLRGRYWRWRRETAFGDRKVGWKAEAGMVLEYARWVYRMKRGVKRRGGR